MFSRTSSGIRNKSLFYSDEYFVYVEGKDDVAFWKIFFSTQTDKYKSKIIAVGGKEEIKKNVDLIINDNDRSKFIVAMDSDYKLLLGEDLSIHPRIIETQCHSIENLMLFPSSISLIICNHAKIDNYDKEVIEQWLDNFDSIAYDLMIADVLIDKEKLSKKCIGEKCQQFLKDKDNSHEFDVLKINLYIQSLNLPDDLKKDLFDRLKNFLPRYHIRGHFYFSAVAHFIYQEIKRLKDNKSRASISDESFYTLALTSFKANFSESDLSNYLLEKAILAAKDVVKLIKNK